MADRGIIFSAPMVRALLEGRKTQTRRLCAWANNPNSPQLTYIVACDEPGWFGDEEGEVQFRAFCMPGDRLYVREHWRISSAQDELAPRDLPPGLSVEYVADDRGSFTGKHRQGMHMPRWASRLWLAITDVRVERLQDCSEADAIAEGICRSYPTSEDHEWLVGYHKEYYGAPPSQADIDDFNKGVWIIPGTDCGFGPKPRQPLWGPTAVSAYQALWNSLNTAEGTTWDANPWVVAVSFDVHDGNIDRVQA